jgi:N4-gp56 family major capsid protein
MTFEYTGVAETPGIGDNTVKMAYDLAFNRVLDEQPTFRMFVSKRPERPSMPGSSIRLPLYDNLADTTVAAAKVPLDELADVDSTKLPETLYVDLTYEERGFSVTTTKKIGLMSFADIETEKAFQVARHSARTADSLVVDTAVTGTQKLYSSTHTAEGDIVAAEEADAADFRKAKTWLRTNSAQPWYGNFHAAYVHPHIVHDLREETSAGGWRVPHEYGMSQERIWNGEIGEFEGMRFVENANARITATGSGSALVYRSFIMGREAIAEGMLVKPGIVVSPVVDRLRRFYSLGWYMCGGWCLYRDKAMVQILTSSSLYAAASASTDI